MDAGRADGIPWAAGEVGRDRREEAIDNAEDGGDLRRAEAHWIAIERAEKRSTRACAYDEPGGYERR